MGKAPQNAFTLQIKDLRLGEFDLGGVLYHANYFHLLEMAREAFLHAKGVPYPTLVEKGQHLAIAESHQNFYRPIFYGEELTINLWSSDCKQSSVVFNYEILSGKQQKHYAWTKLAFIEKQEKGLKPARLPENLFHIFQDIARSS